MQRLGANLRRQDWFAVVLEVLIVVVGIFIGMQVTNWNEDRKQARLAAGYRQSLIAELKADRITALEREVYFTAVSGYGRRALAFLVRPPGEAPADPVRLVTAFMLASCIWEFGKSSATFDDLKSTGNFPLIGSLPLRVELATYYTSVDQMALQWNRIPDYRRHMRSIVPPDVQRLIMETCENVTVSNVVGQLVLAKDCRPDIPPTQAQAILDAILASPGIHEDLNWSIAHQDVMVRLYHGQALASEKMLARVEKELQR